MLALISAALMTLALVAPAVPSSAPNPFTVDASPQPAPTGLSLPKIGGTHVASPACAAHRDLVIPSIGAALRSDARYVKAKTHLSEYIDHSEDSITWGGVKRKFLSAIDRDALAMLDDSLVISRALGDPRLSKKSTDPQIIAERAALQKLFEAQNARAWLLYNFARNGMLADLRNRDSADPFSASGLLPQGSSDIAIPPPDPHALPTPDDGYPLQSGIQLGDRRSIDDWSGEIGREVKEVEVGVAPSLIALSQACR